MYAEPDVLGTREAAKKAKKPKLKSFSGTSMTCQIHNFMDYGRYCAVSE